VDPTTGDSFFLELPHHNSLTFHLWIDGFSEAFLESCTIVVLDKGACHQAKAVQWPSNVVPLVLPPYSPELNPIERLWRHLKDHLANRVCHTLDEWSDAVCAIIQGYSEAALKSLTGFNDFVQAVETARQASV
jgi:DDE superfamily endonuclease